MAGELALGAWTPPWQALAALVLEALLGYPRELHKVAPHPVTWLGAAIGRCERTLNRPAWPDPVRRALGAATVLAISGVAVASGALLQLVLANAPWGVIPFALVATVGLAQNSLYRHVADVAAALTLGNLTAARDAVGLIVGRDVATLSHGDVAAAALESLSESFNDGVVAPAFWLLIGGLPGLFAYKAVNTADSIIGHMEPRWRAFGWAAARLDDLLNLIPARVAGLLIVIAGRGGLLTMLQQAQRHASPNAGWPEAAMAGALNVRLGGSATYDGITTDRPHFGEGPRPEATDVGRGLRVYLMACATLWALLGVWGIAWPR